MGKNLKLYLLCPQQGLGFISKHDNTLIYVDLQSIMTSIEHFMGEEETVM